MGNIMKRAAKIKLAFMATMVAAPVFAQAPPEEDKPTSAVADSWIGVDASELLMQWPVDAGFTQIEDEKTGETLYTYNFGTDAYSYDNPIYGQQYMSGMDRGHPIYSQPIVGYERIDVPAVQHCAITFGANREGIIHRYAYNGWRCRPYAKNWGRPKSSKKKTKNK